MDGPPNSLQQTAVDECLTPRSARPCEEEGVAIDCCTVTEHRGEYVICSPGTRTCTDGAWGECSSSNAIVTPQDVDSD